MTEREILREEISRQYTARLIAHLEAERAIVPGWHPLHEEVVGHLRDLRRVMPVGPRRLPEVDA